jgi:hypothetical protein
MATLLWLRIWQGISQHQFLMDDSLLFKTHYCSNYRFVVSSKIPSQREKNKHIFNSYGEKLNIFSLYTFYERQMLATVYSDSQIRYL